VLVKEGQGLDGFSLRAVRGRWIPFVLPAQVMEEPDGVRIQFDTKGMKPLSGLAPDDAVLLVALGRAVQRAFELEEEYLIDRGHLCFDPQEVFLDGNGDVWFALQGTRDGHLGCLVGRLLGGDMPTDRPLPRDRADWIALLGDVQRARAGRRRILGAQEKDSAPEADAAKTGRLKPEVQAQVRALQERLREPHQVYRLWALCFAVGILYAVLT